MRRAYLTSDINVVENKHYILTAIVYPHPQTQESTLLVTDAKAVQDDIDTFTLTDEIREELKIFRPEKIDKKSIEEKLGEITRDLCTNVCDVIDRENIVLGVLLTQHSALWLYPPWDGSKVNGWINYKVLGDSSTGKSRVISKLLKYGGLGTTIDASAAKRTGVLYSAQQPPGSTNWIVLWGAWAQSHKGLCWIDEASSAAKDIWPDMRGARSEGILSVHCAAQAEASAEVRTIISGNVLTGDLAQYQSGAAALSYIFEPQDIRRFDLATFCKRTDVAYENINAAKPNYPKIITASALKHNQLFAWTRKERQITYAEGTAQAVWDASNFLQGKYGDNGKVPLIADMKHKILRLAVSLAIFTNSVDEETGETIIVYPAHVEVMSEFVDGEYSNQACGLLYYSKVLGHDEIIDAKRIEQITTALRSNNILNSDSRFKLFIVTVVQKHTISAQEIETTLAIDRDEAKTIINTMVRLKLLRRHKTNNTYAKTSRCNNYVSACCEQGALEEGELE